MPAVLEESDPSQYYVVFLNGEIAYVTTPALLALEDGAIFRGVSIGAEAVTLGEVVFNTAMTGYQEILSDPSYARQIVTLTYPHIGNTGTNDEDMESHRLHASGLVVRDVPRRLSNWRNQRGLSEFLIEHKIPGIADIDTRKLTRHLRQYGAMSGTIVIGDAPDVDHHVKEAKALAGLSGLDLAREVTCSEPHQWKEGSWTLESAAAGNGAATTSSESISTHSDYHVVAMDFGVKRNILRLLVDRGCRVTVVPAQTTVSAILALNPDGVFLSNGPGDPEPCVYAIDTIAALTKARMPLFGICLGHQLLALASGARTHKMKFGHHGANHPVQELHSGNVYITSQNHGFAVDETSMVICLDITHRSLFDGTIQGIQRNDVPAFSFQGHPEASPGPHDMAPLFDQFIALMSDNATAPGTQ